MDSKKNIGSDINMPQKKDEERDRYLDPFTDFGFKKLFGTEPNKDLLIDFLNQLISDEGNIVDLEYMNTEKFGKTKEDRKAIFDLYCKNEKGERFIIEMPKFKKEEEELETRFEKWLYVLKNMNNLQEIPHKLQERIFKKVFRVAEIDNFTRAERANYEQSLKNYRDLNAVVTTAKDDGFKDGMEKGIEKGIEKGLEKGRLEEKMSTTKLQIKRKFKLDILSDELNNYIKNADDKVLDSFKELIFDIETLEDVMEYFTKNNI